MLNKKELKKYSRSKKFYCCITNEIISPDRVEYLLSEGVSEDMLTSLKGAELTYKPRKMIIVDDEGTHFFCDKIDNTRAWAHERFGDSPPEDTNYLDDIEEKKRKKSEEVSVSSVEGVNIVTEEGEEGEDEI